MSEKDLKATPSLEAERRSSYGDEKKERSDEPEVASQEHISEDLDEHGKERPIETDMDVATRLISLEDDPTLPVYTFLMWFLGIGLSCFGAVLGQIFYFRPQTVFVSQLFIQIIAYILGRLLEEFIPGPGNEKVKFQTKDTPFWRMQHHVLIAVLESHVPYHWQFRLKRGGYGFIPSRPCPCQVTPILVIVVSTRLIPTDHAKGSQVGKAAAGKQQVFTEGIGIA